MLKQQSSITIYPLPTKENKFRRFHLQQTNESLPFTFSVCSKQTEVAAFHEFRFLYTYVYICCRFKMKREAQAIFFNLFTVWSSCKGKFVICPFVDEETKGSYCSVSSPRRPHVEYKRMVLEHTHGLFIT